MCCESSGRVSDSEHSAVFSVGMCRMVDIICLFLQADSGSGFAFQGTYVCLT